MRFRCARYCWPSSSACPRFAANGLYEAACIIGLFPLIVAAGAGGQLSGAWARASKFLGDISYPLYITHYAFIYPYTAWVTLHKPGPQQALPVALGVFAAALLLAYAALRLYDEPVRQWLKKRVLPQSACWRGGS